MNEIIPSVMDEVVHVSTMTPSILVSSVISLVIDIILICLAILIIRIVVKEGLETIGYRFTLQSSNKAFKYFFVFIILIAAFLGITAILDLIGKITGTSISLLLLIDSILDSLIGISVFGILITLYYLIKPPRA